MIIWCEIIYVAWSIQFNFNQELLALTNAIVIHIKPLLAMDHGPWLENQRCIVDIVTNLN